MRVGWWIFDNLARLDAHPRASAACGFALIWVGGTIGLHFIPRWYGDDPKGFVLSWGDATGTSFVVAAIAIPVFFALFRRH